LITAAKKSSDTSAAVLFCYKNQSSGYGIKRLRWKGDIETATGAGELERLM
jgi:hypothetical protein